MKPRSVVIAMAVAAGFTAGLTGCTPIPDYTYVTVTSANPWMPGTRTMWVVQGTAVERTETFPDDGVEASSTLNYQLLDQQAFLKAVHRALNVEQNSPCMDAVEFTVQARDAEGGLYSSNLQQCGNQQEYVADLLDALDADRA